MNELEGQLELFRPDLQARFEAWAHSEDGRKVMDRFIKIAWGVMCRGKRIGAAAIFERLRWNYMVKRGDGEKWALNNSWTAYAARFAMNREPRLDGFFETRDLVSRRNRPARRVLVVDLAERRTA